MAKAKWYKPKSKSEPDIRLTFATSKLASEFASFMESEYPSCIATLSGETVSIRAPEPILVLVKQHSEDPGYRRTGISIFNPCLVKKGSHKK